MQFVFPQICSRNERIRYKIKIKSCGDKRLLGTQNFKSENLNKECCVQGVFILYKIMFDRIHRTGQSYPQICKI